MNFPIEARPYPAIGHTCWGGGATIKNSPIVIHIHVHSVNEHFLLKIKRSIYGLLGQRHIAVTGVADLSSDDIQGSIIRQIENR